ncbi:uncharacterized protein LOC113561604 [Ooceraea biroi]|uniref:uncharacterized protein LOC113561604 n=1 Tax=Ooceraea biroi TaxID=2015173 RepID=UPI000F081AE9|nr:uncharacterized protein LOC113561604 [Ooceraea biroi]
MAADLGLCLLNTGSGSTCVHWQGESIVDLTWASPSLVRVVRGWEVVRGETLSDHRHIWFSLALLGRSPLRCRGGQRAPARRWVLGRLCEDTLVAALKATTWGEQPPRTVVEEADWFGRILADACDASMPRAGQPDWRAAYWWCDVIDELRRCFVRARQQFQRARRRGVAHAKLEERYREWRAALYSLRAAIGKSKAKT